MTQDNQITFRQYGDAKQKCNAAKTEVNCQKASVTVNEMDADIRCEWTKMPLEVKGSKLETGVMAGIKGIFSKGKTCSVAPAAEPGKKKVVSLV